MALAAKVRDDELLVIDDLSFAAPKTKDMVAILKHLDCERRQSLLVTTAKYDRNVYRSARNIAGVSVSPARELNALSVLSSQATAGDQGGARCAGGRGQEMHSGANAEAERQAADEARDDEDERGQEARAQNEAE